VSVNMEVVSPPEEPPSVATRNRIVCFVNDELSAAALRKASKVATYRSGVAQSVMPLRCSETTPSYSHWCNISGIDDPFTELERLSASAHPMSGWL